MIISSKISKFAENWVSVPTPSPVLDPRFFIITSLEPIVQVCAGRDEDIVEVHDDGVDAAQLLDHHEHEHDYRRFAVDGLCEHRLEAHGAGLLLIGQTIFHL